VLPIAITGGIHLDGFCDTSDALASHAEPERRREILKDPHTGAFAVINVAVYIVAYFALAACLPHDIRAERLLAIGFVLSRTLSAWLVVALPNVGDGTGKIFRDAASQKVTAFLGLWNAVSLIGMKVSAGNINGSATVLAALIPVPIIIFIAKRRFNGMSGDLSGWFLQVCEICQLAAIVLAAYILK
jgi:adenosylcobinamide-GDP ribazoletransferase